MTGVKLKGCMHCCSARCGSARCREKVTKAMKVCARNAFLPEAHRNPEEAFMDSPIHLDGLHFNVSAPHMHATCLVRHTACSE